ncbi:SdpI family protein [Streptobacillus notomytis]|uniref:SdpI family protein n=1 Tax=Streptobacillus notomytis TaxID=1712031 RepID=UPI00093568AA|nr:SdpI family protein [Streptobacillus notomytis]
MKSFLLINIFLTPALMILLGYLWTRRFPANVNKLYGYRTKWSMLSQEAWTFSNKMFSKLFFIFGIISLIFTVICDKNNFSFLIFIQMILLFLPIVLTEIILRIFFDDKGKKK